MTEYESQLNAVADLSTSPGWAIVCQYLDGLVTEAYDRLSQCKSSNNAITAGFAREFIRKREIVAAVKTFVSDKLQERIRLNEEEAERLERERLIGQLGEQAIEHSTDPDSNS